MQFVIDENVHRTGLETYSTTLKTHLKGVTYNI